MVTGFLQDLFDREKTERHRDVKGILRDITEYREAARNNARSNIFLGVCNQRCGNVFVIIIGGFEGKKHFVESLSQTGVGTIMAMHLIKEHRQ